MPSPEELFAAGRLLARQKAKYMSAVLLAFAPVETPGLRTIAVTENAVLLINWEFIASIAQHAPNGTQAAEEMGGCLVHEALHILLHHCKRARNALRVAKISNMADDLSINDMVEEMGLRLPGGPNRGIYPKDYGWESKLTSDEYYEKLMQLVKSGKMQHPGEAESGEGDDGEGGEGDPDQDNDEEGEGGQGSDADHEHQGKGGKRGKQPPEAPGEPKVGGGWCGSCAGNPVPNEPGASHKAARSEAEMERVARTVAAAIRDEVASNGRGNIPGGLVRWAEEMFAPSEVPWDEKFATLCRVAVAWGETAVDHKYDAPSRKQGGIGYGPGLPIMPRYRAPLPHVVVIVDTSGSMGPKELGEAGREINGILETLNCDITFVACDAAVNGISKVSSMKEALAGLVGGGGTDMRPAIEAVAKLDPTPDVMVCITDLCIGDVGPEPLETKMIWVGVGPYQASQPDPAWGDVVRIPHKIEEKKAS